MSLDPTASEAVTSIVSGVTGGVLIWLSIVMRGMWQRRKSKPAEPDPIALRRLDREGGASERLFDTLDSRLKIAEGRCAECLEAKEELEHQLAEERGMRIRFEAAFEIVCAALRAHGIPLPAMPLLGIYKDDSAGR